MHKKLESDLISLAHSLLQMKNKENVFLLKQKAHEIYEKLSVLAFVEEYVNTTPGVNVKKEALILKVEEAYKVKDQSSKEADEANKVEVIAGDFKEVLLDVENKKTNVDIEDNFSKEEKNLEEIEDQGINETKEFLEVEEITETEQPFNDLENLIFTTFVQKGKVDALKKYDQCPEKMIVIHTLSHDTTKQYHFF